MKLSNELDLTDSDADQMLGVLNVPVNVQVASSITVVYSIAFWDTISFSEKIIASCLIKTYLLISINKHIHLNNITVL